MAILFLIVMMYVLAIIIVNAWHKTRMKITGVTSMSVNMDKRFREYFKVFCFLFFIGLVIFLAI